jgi:DNA-directed RNA polymerase specialized sigma24 family protein
LTATEFERFAAGNEAELTAFFKQHYGYVTGWLIYREHCPPDQARQWYADAVLRVRLKAMQGEVSAGNLRAYLLKTAINFHKMEQRRETSLLKRHEKFLEQLPPDPANQDYDALIQEEDTAALNSQQQKNIIVLQQALALLGDGCRQLLTDTILNGIKVGQLVEKYGLKDARGVTAKKQDCKGQLQRLVQKVMQQLGWTKDQISIPMP